MFVFANICDCALRKTVYDRSDRSIDRSKHVCVMLDMVDFSSNTNMFKSFMPD